MQRPDTQRPKMAPGWKPLPDEVYEKLMLCHPYCALVYLSLRFRFSIEEDYRFPGEWVTGKVRATKVEIIRESQVTENILYRKLWPDLKKVGLVEDDDDGWVTLPYVWRKADVSISATQVLEMEQAQEESDRRIEDLERRLHDMEERLAEEELDDPSPETGSVAEITGSVADITATEPVSSSFKEESKVSLSAINKLISGFYRSIGQKRIPGPMREKAVKSFQKLMKEGYKPGEIEFALGWIPENATEPVKHFGIVPHMIEQALEAGRKELEIQEAEEAKEKARQEAERNRLNEQQERQAVENYKAQLSDEDREQLRNDALNEVRGIEGIKSDFISDSLVEAQENMIIRKAGIDLTSFRDPGDGENV